MTRIDFKHFSQFHPVIRMVLKHFFHFNGHAFIRADADADHPSGGDIRTSLTFLPEPFSLRPAYLYLRSAFSCSSFFFPSVWNQLQYCQQSIWMDVYSFASCGWQTRRWHLVVYKTSTIFTYCRHDRHLAISFHRTGYEVNVLVLLSYAQYSFSVTYFCSYRYDRVKGFRSLSLSAPKDWYIVCVKRAFKIQTEVIKNFSYSSRFSFSISCRASVIFWSKDFASVFNLWSCCRISSREMFRWDFHRQSILVQTIAFRIRSFALSMMKTPRIQLNAAFKFLCL